MERVLSRIEKLNKIKNGQSVDAFLISSPSSVKYFSGYFFYFEYGASPFHLLPAVFMSVPGVAASLIIADNETGNASLQEAFIDIVPYESYTYEKPADPAGACLKKISAFIVTNKLMRARIGIEYASIPFFIVNELKTSFPSIQWIDIGTEITKLKMIKDEDEISFIRQAAALADIGQVSVIKYAKAGMTELELFSLVHRDMELSAGLRIPLMSDLSCGTGTNSGGGMPTDKIIETGDPLLSDFQPCLQGYWGDSCNTVIVGADPTEGQKKTFQLVKEALEIGINSIKPGVKAKEIDRRMRNHIGSYPHHSGHSVGTKYHEEPRITPYNETELMAGMIIALEPAIYQPEYGVRLEHLMLVTTDGSEILTKFDHRFEQ
ncbi:MAG TPA: Xaa-Pro peptidase family protein [Puia sp.]|jgi:Xaa-Pro aminopeptidase